MWKYNTLAATGDRAGKYKLVYPDGLRFEAAYDLGICCATGFQPIGTWTR